VSTDVVCLRPEADFTRAGVHVNPALNVAYRAPADADVASLMAAASALVIPAVGPKLVPDLFRSTRLKLVQVTGAGVDRLEEDALRALGIAVANVPGGSNAALAEYAVAVASFLLRRFGWADAEIRAGRYAQARARLVADGVSGLDGLLVGIVGMGTVGRAVAAAFEKAGSRVEYFDTRPIERAPVPLHQLLAAADIVTLHVPLLAETRNLIGERELTLMKPSAILINAARGGVVDEAALANALQEGRIAGAAIDVYSNEPPAADSPLLTLKDDAASRVIFTPHIAGVTRQSAAFLFRSAWENVERVVLRGEAPLNRVY